MIVTLGHSSREITTFVAILHQAEVTRLLDVRARPGSRRFPWFGRRPLQRSLTEAGIAYRHLPALGGRREPERDSPNTALRTDWERGYADWMRSIEFREALEELQQQAEEEVVALMCAEGDPRHCHRWLIADALHCRGSEAVHLATPEGDYPHPGSDGLECVNGGPLYPAPRNLTLGLEGTQS